MCACIYFSEHCHWCSLYLFLLERAPGEHSDARGRNARAEWRQSPCLHTLILVFMCVCVRLPVYTQHIASHPFMGISDHASLPASVMHKAFRSETASTLTAVHLCIHWYAIVLVHCDVSTDFHISSLTWQRCCIAKAYCQKMPGCHNKFYEAQHTPLAALNLPRELR